MKLGIIGWISEESEKNQMLFESTKKKGLEFLELCINVKIYLLYAECTQR